MVRIVGVDPGFANLGLGALEVVPGHLPTVEFARTVETSPDQETEDRLHDLVVAVLEIGKADYYATENQHGVRAGKWKAGQRTNAKALYVLEVVGMLRLLALAHNPDQPLAVLDPSTLRALLGLPRDAGKKDLERVVLANTTGLDSELQGIAKPKREHAVDAIALALATAVKLGFFRIL